MPICTNILWENPCCRMSSRITLSEACFQLLLLFFEMRNSNLTLVNWRSIYILIPGKQRKFMDIYHKYLCFLIVLLRLLICLSMIKHISDLQRGTALNSTIPNESVYLIYKNSQDPQRHNYDSWIFSKLWEDYSLFFFQTTKIVT